MKQEGERLVITPGNLSTTPVYGNYGRVASMVIVFVLTTGSAANVCPSRYAPPGRCIPPTVPGGTWVVAQQDYNEIVSIVTNTRSSTSSHNQ